MTEQTTLLSRIGRWFKGGDRPESGIGESTVIGDPHPHHANALETRTTFLRPWAKRDAAIQQLQDGFVTLTDLMGSIRDNLERQNARQDELLGALSQLPQVLQSLPENSRVHTETLQTIRQQIEGQSAQQEKLGQILERIGQNTGEQRSMVDALRTRVEDLHQADTSIAEYLNNVGSALKDVSKNSHSSAEVLENMRSGMESRDKDMQEAMHRQSTRFTTMLATAIFLSIAALAAVCVMGYLIINNGGHLK